MNMAIATAASAIGIKLVDAAYKLGINLMDPKAIQARGEARTAVQLRSAEQVLHNTVF